MRRAVLIILFYFAVVFIAPAQTFTNLVDFNGTNDENANAPVIQGRDGNFYGMTSQGGAKTYGTVFKITPEGMLTTLYSFCSQINCADGSFRPGLSRFPPDVLRLASSFGLRQLD